ncbi:MAG: hypothetical protein M3P15_10910 [Actinomycetota bacterium]|nr:hypothetical protein [Actinomycetota bacterium]
MTAGEETDWAGAPVLEDAATYWIVNSLLDSLSNETMLAIARGLRPLE